MPRLRGLYIIESSSFDMVYGPEERAAIEAAVDLIGPAQTKQSIAAKPELLADVDVLFLGWGAPVMDEAFLNKAPKLRAIFYAAGAISSWCTPAVWNRGIIVTTATEANSIPVAEYTLATMLFSLKHGWSLARGTRETRTFLPRDGAPGAYGSTVGLISLGAVSRALVGLLRPFDVKLLGYDPHVTPAEMRALGLIPASMDEIFSRSDVVSLHTPLLPETEGLITGTHLSSMKPGATFINTARGEIVREGEMIEVLKARPDVHAVLDVTEVEPPAATSPLYSLPNVVLTPHIAGSVGKECRRMGRYMVDELGRYLRGDPLWWQVRPEATENTAHRVAGVLPRNGKLHPSTAVGAAAAGAGSQRLSVPA